MQFKRKMAVLFAVFLILFTGGTGRAVNQVDAPQKCAILLYHHLTEGIPEEFENSTSLKKFERDMQRMLEAGYQPISLDEMYEKLSAGEPLPERSVVITFDDGYESNYTLAYPVLKRHKIPATIFMNNDLAGKISVNGLPHFSWEQAKEMEASGLVTVQSHGYTHHDFTSIPIEQLAREYSRSRQEIEEKLGKRKHNMVAYVGGDFNSKTFQALHDAGAEVQLLVAYQNSYSSIWGYSFFSRMTVYYTSDVNEMLEEYYAS